MPATLLAGILRAEDSLTVRSLDDATLTSAVNEALAFYTNERDEANRFFVERQTDASRAKVTFDHMELGQRLGIDGRPLAARAAASAQVAFQWDRYGWNTGWNLEDFARLTVADVQAKTNAITAGNARTHTLEILRAVFPKDNYTFADSLGDLEIKRLANGDAQLYPNGDGSEETANHYHVTGYLPAAFSVTNNPFKRSADALHKRFGDVQPVVVFVNDANVADILAKVPGMVDAGVSGISPAFGEQVATALQGTTVPGKFVGIDQHTGVYVYKWNRIPAGYQLAISTVSPAPLWRRVPDIASLVGFRIEAEETYNPFFERIWRERYGYSVANRLSMVITQYAGGDDTTYATPTAYV